MATHSSALAWRIPGTGSLVGCGLWGLTESDTTEATEQQQQAMREFLNSCNNSPERSVPVLLNSADQQPNSSRNQILSILFLHACTG